MRVNRDVSIKRRDMLKDIMGGIIDVRLANFDQFAADSKTYGAFAGMYFFGLTWQLHRFVGMDNMMYWYYDFPEAMHALMRYLTDDRKRLYTLLESESCVSPNTDNVKSGPNFYGHCDDLPAPTGECGAKLSNCWAWAESQETTGVSCEMLRDQYVYSRKPASPTISGPSADWNAARLTLKKRNAPPRRGILRFFIEIYTIFMVTGKGFRNGLIPLSIKAIDKQIKE